MVQKKGVVDFKQEKKKSKLNSFYVKIKLRLIRVIFQQHIIWEELFQINNMQVLIFKEPFDTQ